MYSYITRKKWIRLSPAPDGGIRIQPTNSPDGCIVISDVEHGMRHGWQPTAEDLTADDWEIVSADGRPQSTHE
jgi:hypothetical protein